MEKTKYIKKVTLTGLLFCIFLGGLLTYVFSRKNYFPLADLFNNVISKNLKSVNNNGNEYERIRSAFEGIIEDKNQINMKLTSQKGIVQSNYLEKLLKGRFDSANSMVDSLSAFDINFSMDRFTVVVFSIENIGETHEEKDNIASNKDFQLSQFIIINISEEMLSEVGRAYGVEMDKNVALLINLNNSDTAQVKEKIKHICSNIKEFIKEKFNIHVTISISSIHETIIGIPKAYDECLRTMEYKMLAGTEKILCSEELEEPINSDYYYPLEIEQKLINTIKTGEYDGIEDILDKVFKRNFKENGLSVQMSKCLMFNIFSTANKALNEITNLEQEHFLESSNSMEILMRCETIDSMKAQIKYIMKNVCEYIQAKNVSEESSMRGAICKYIESNYQDSTLSVEKIADYFGKSRGYLFSQFKDKTGEGLLYQINKERIGRAKQLMIETSLSISEISERVGISNVNSFIRIFKKYEGVTPGKYRELIGENKLS